MNSSLTEQIAKLRLKYEHMGQDMNAYLDGLLLSNYLTYWDYVHLDTLLTLQSPRTDFPDEHIFIIYHQITELYFKLSLHELEQISKNGIVIDHDGKVKGHNSRISVEFLTERIRRINAYFESLTKSFEIMINGMEKEQFMRFRMALLPASGFQSAQYRMIEIGCTDLSQLVESSQRRKPGERDDRNIEELFEHIYWKQGATELASGKKTLTLRQFENKYTDKLKELAHYYKDCNVWRKFCELNFEGQRDPELLKQMRQLDINVNVNWPLVHFKSAVRYLHSKEETAAATGGTNWQKYLPPRLQLRVFFPLLWSKEEMENWGKGWVEEVGHDYIKLKG